MKLSSIMMKASIVLSKCNENITVVKMSRESNISYSNTAKIKNILLKEGILLEESHHNYKLTDKGIQIQNHIISIINAVRWEND